MNKYFSILILILSFFFSDNKASIAQPAKAPAKQIEVKNIRIVGNTVFSDEELRKIIGSFDKKLSFEELLNIRTKITDHYVSAGYISSGAFVPPQNLDSETLLIEVIEGKIETIKITTENYTDSKYILKQVPIKGRVFNINLLKQYLNQLQNKPFIDRIGAELTKVDIGKLDLTLRVEENSRLTRRFSFTNAYASSIGNYGAAANLNYYLFGFGDRIGLFSVKTKGLERYSVAYSLPLNSYNTNLFFEYTNAQSELVNDETEELGIAGDFNLYQIGLNQPVILGAKSQAELELSFKLIRSETFVLDDFSFAFVDGLQNGASKTSELSLRQGYSYKGEKSAISVNSTFNIGIDAFDPTVSDLGRDALYWNWQLKAENVFQATTKLKLYSQVDLQITEDQLLPGAQLSLGGTGSVRGYRQNFALGDSGVFVSTEAQYLLTESQTSQLKLIAFFEGGTVWNNQLSSNRQEDLLSIGLGLEYAPFKQLNLRVEHGIPLTKSEDISSSFSDRTTFSIVYEQ